jgi:peptide/nickel transport system permease protein
MNNPLTRVLSPLLILIFLAIAVPFFLPDPNTQNLLETLRPPFLNWQHILGTDELGRDMLSQLLHGLRISLLVGLLCSLISACIGVPLGLIAGLRGAWLETLIMRATEVQMALPTVLLALVTLALLGAGLSNLIFVIGVFGWAGFARYTRAVVLIERQLEYVLAAKALGANDHRTVLRHILPNVSSGILLQISLDFPQNIMLEASLSFLGVGVGIDTPSLGAMVSRGYNHLFSGAWWLSFLPGGLIMLLVWNVTTISEKIRVLTDPRVRVLTDPRVRGLTDPRVRGLTDPRVDKK